MVAYIHYTVYVGVKARFDMVVVVCMYGDVEARLDVVVMLRLGLMW